MDKKIINKVLSYKWEPWLKRNLHAFVLSLFEGSGAKETFKKIGLPGWELEVIIFTEGYWYWSDEVFDKSALAPKEWLKSHKVSEISDSLEKFYTLSLNIINELSHNSKLNVKDKLAILEDIFCISSAYIWSAHMLEHVLWQEMKKRTVKYIKSDLDKYIGDAAYPEKKNALELMEEEMRAGVGLKEIRKKYSWMRARDGFSRPYNLKELEEHRSQLKKHSLHIYPNVPKQLKSLYKEARELVYFRTKRTDVLFELIFKSRPILKEAAKKYKVKFTDLKYYSLEDLILGKPHRYSNNISYIGYKNDSFISNEKLFAKQEIDSSVKEIKGMIAQMGCVKGIVKIVLNVRETAKVQKGDILVTYMTSPDFLQAMKKAAAFVTNEGGLTCHAAIIARELKKPCIIGTKIATKVLHDGDWVEVDANKGIVKIIKKK